MANHKLSLISTLATTLKGTTAVGYPTSSALDANTQALDVAARSVGNTHTKFNDALEAFDITRWTIVNQASGDILGMDGNTASSSYMIISKDPLQENIETVIESIQTLDMPARVGFAPSLSQRIFGQESSFEMVSVVTGSTPAMTVYTPLALASISQTTTTLTAVTSVAHGLLPGDRASIYGVTGDTRLNYPVVIVATVSTDGKTFTATVQPGATFSSITTGPFTSQGTVTKSDPMYYSRNGVSVIFDAGTATAASYYVRSEGGSALPSGVINASPNVTFGNTAATVLASSGNAYAFAPANMYDIICKSEGLSLSAVTVDSASSSPTVVKRTQVVPNPIRDYKLRLRAKNHRSLTRPSAKIVSVAKSGTTTATVTTDVAHGLVTGDWVVVYGNRDTTNFPNVTAQVQVLSVPTTTTLTMIIGSAATATSYGGLIAKVNGSNVGGFNAATIQNIVRASNVVTLTTSATPTGIVTGEYVNLYGVCNAAGTNLGIDGAYRIRDIQTTTTTLEPISMTINGTTTNYSPTGADIGSTVAGGAIIKRTDYRLHFIRAVDNDKLLVEFAGGGRADRLEAIPVLNTDTSANLLISSGTPMSSTGPQASTRALGVLPAIGSTVTDKTTTTAITSSSNSGSVADDMGAAISAVIKFTSVSGTTPTLDLTLEESYDSGVTFVPIYQFPRMTANGNLSLPPILIGGWRRWSWVVSGTTPSFTTSIITTRLASAPVVRQFYDRTLNVNTAAAASATFATGSALQFNAHCTLSSIGSGASPQISFDTSHDGVNWVQQGGPITFAATGTQIIFGGQLSAPFCRFRTVVAGTSAVLTQCSLSAVN